MASLNGYAFAFVSSGTLTVDPATLTITAVTETKTYDGNTSSTGIPVAASGLVNGDTIGGFTQIFQSRNVLGPNGSTLVVNAGSGTVNDGNSGNNYTLVYQTATGTIAPATLTVPAVTDSKTYDGNTSSTGGFRWWPPAWWAATRRAALRKPSSRAMCSAPMARRWW